MLKNALHTRLVNRSGKKLFDRMFMMTIAACFLSSASVVYAAGWDRYVNPRFGTNALVPEDFFEGAESDNGDGKSFFAKSGRGEIRIYGQYNVLSEDLEGYRQQRIGFIEEDGAEITYAPTGENWFVLSGYEGGDIFYLRVMHAPECSPAVIHSIYIRYPKEDKALWDEIVAKASGSLYGPCE